MKDLQKNFALLASWPILVLRIWVSVKNLENYGKCNKSLDWLNLSIKTLKKKNTSIEKQKLY